VRRVASTEDGRNWLTQTFTLCKPLEANETDAFIAWLSSTYESLAMIDYPNPASFLQPLPAYPIGVVCQHLTNPNQNDKALLRDIFNGVSVYYNYTGQTKCNDITEDSPDLGMDGWNFQVKNFKFI
jgi:lysosomal Pro-X carboxypeptidase